ncbi:MAG: hypothetical protein F4Z75_06260 [Synechococcus sp. SB0668_bin_15]|nr:hypothetical protein [Synechococcus sp. SB0668_bin_15]MXZ83976.1 hypothetical protein [Synechococcus sp. SB0666_bin_14]MYA90347.1 hypothetical protein [Synechococcus sp. SB0663_bin_10]MYC50332.1 hypothetical protein [Synechococcus sp. SB0662_bin_14]MYG46497.1 hypothetical protein [Synechococcus sp. SB0675_bin_6]MYJ59457.1 hypothetical protein [Synechococcus sp. SB0672_bin_6]MYK91318.1 hypothetical protein [Synechococcus sp. SB0669_bin_8]
MPTVPPGLTERLALLTQPAVILVGMGLLINQRNKRIDDLREDVKELRKKVDDLSDEVKGLPLKIMEMLRKAPH